MPHRLLSAALGLVIVASACGGETGPGSEESGVVSLTEARRFLESLEAARRGGDPSLLSSRLDREAEILPPGEGLVAGKERVASWLDEALARVPPLAPPSTAVGEAGPRAAYLSWSAPWPPDPVARGARTVRVLATMTRGDEGWRLRRLVWNDGGEIERESARGDAP